MKAMRLLVLVWGLLMALLLMTVGASVLLRGPASLAAGLAIALGKAGLIYWFFMHLREESGLVRLAALGAGAWLLVFLALLGTDYAMRS